MITVLIPFRVKCDAHGCAATAMGTCAQDDLCVNGPAIIQVYAPALPEGWTLTLWGAHRCPMHEELP